MTAWRVVKFLALIWLLSGCTAAQAERTEDNICSLIAKEYPKLPEGKLKDRAAAVAIMCDLEEAAEHAADGGTHPDAAH